MMELKTGEGGSRGRGGESYYLPNQHMFTRERGQRSEEAVMLISNEMRNKPALALRLINGKITPRSSLMK